MFSKKNKEINLEVKPLNYWEINSYLIYPIQSDYINRDSIIEKFNKNKDIKLIGLAEPDDEKDGRIVFKYDNKNYEINYYFHSFELPTLYDYQIRDFNEEELSILRQCKNSLVLFMDCKDNGKLKYKLQLLIGDLIVDNNYGVLDESAEKLLHPNFVKMIINSKYFPSDESLYSIQAIVNETSIWLHTHGLSRFGLPELEILDSNEKVYNEHYNVISALANNLLDKGLSDNNEYILGLLKNEIPLVIKLRPWNDALKEYNNIDLGGPLDRKFEHNSNYSVLFVYASEDDMNNKKTSKMSIYNDIICDDPLLLLTDEETNRMSMVAQERFNYVKEAFQDKKNSIMIKIGVITNEETKDREHIWFELIDIKDNKLDLKLINKPYSDINLEEGKIYTYDIKDITDWVIYMENMTINPDSVYRISVK